MEKVGGGANTKARKATYQSRGSRADLAITDNYKIVLDDGGHPTELAARKVQPVSS